MRSATRITFCLVLLFAASCKEGTSVARLPSEENSGPRLVRLDQAEMVMDQNEIRATGTAMAAATTKVMPLVPGLVKRIPVNEGDPIKKGQPLVILDQRQYRLQVRQAQAAVEAAKVGLDATTRERQRFEKLLQEDATARAQYDRVLDKHRGAAAQMKQAQVALEMARKALSDAILRAPYNGVVAKKLASVGDYATSMPPTVLMVLQKVNTLELRIALPEPELSRVEVGAKVNVTLPSVDRKVSARIARVSRTVDPMTRSFEAVVEIDNKDLSLRGGLYARVKIAASKPRKRILVPSAAVVDEGNGIYAVYLPRQGKAVRREVRVTTGQRGKTEITSGLEGGETIIAEPIGLFDGDPIKVGAERQPTPTAAPTAAGARAATSQAGTSK